MASKLVFELLPKLPMFKRNTLLNICPEGDRMVVERMGKFNRVENPGWFLSIPIFEKIWRVNMRELTIPITPQHCTTKDNVNVETAGTLYVQVVDAYKACYGADQPLLAISTHAQSTMRTATGGVELDTMFHNRELLNSKLLSDLQEGAVNWGIRPVRYEITDVIPDSAVSDAMDAQSVAERRRRETILNADALRQKYELESAGKKTADINMAEGQKQKVILEAEGLNQSIILEATAQSEREVLEAKGKAQAVELVAQALETEQGRRAMAYQLASTYVKGMTAGMNQSSTVFLPRDVGNVASMMSTAMVVVDEFLQKKETQKSI